ncbi:MAG: hypothetical protein KKF89_04245 [Nanoarchaeota archaeon]|nr:hypothetical protein [Nanoarchaeota archaeon]MBU1854906.1 hypothetical protein [Nanoarchaeota archaeon]
MSIEWSKVKNGMKKTKKTLEETIHTAKEFYLDKAHKINSSIIKTGTYALMADIDAQILNTSVIKSAPLPVIGAMIGKGVEWIYNKGKNNLKTGAYLALTGLATLAGIEVIEIAKDLLIDGQTTYNPFTPETLYGLKNLATIVIPTLGFKAVNKFTEKVKNIQRPTREEKKSREPDMSKRRFIRNTGMAAAGLSLYYLGYMPINRLVNTNKLDSDLETELFLGIEGSKSILRNEISENDIINLTLKLSNAKKYENKNLTVKYFMKNKNTGEIFSLGERQDLLIENRKGELDGIFTYNPSIQEYYEKETPFINPFDDKEPNGNEFSLKVELFDDKKKIAEKWWGDIKNNILDDKKTIKFKIPKKIADKTIDDQIERLEGKPRKVFLYTQHLKADNEKDPAIFSVVDFLQPHFYETKFNSKNNTLKIFDRSANKEYKDYLKRFSEKYDFKITPMISFHKTNEINYALNFPKDVATRIASIIEREGWDGIVLDVENIRFKKNKSEKLTNFVKEVKKAMGDKTVSIATTPNFSEIPKQGYEHHDFYDFEGLSKHADYLQIMAYDFHKGVKGPMNVLPNSKIIDIVNYASDKVQNQDQIVVLLPFYGAKWNYEGSRKPINVTTNIYNYIKKNKRIDEEFMKDGELYVKCGKECYMIQTEQVISERLKILNNTNVGAWRTSFASTDMITSLAQKN